MLDLNPVVLGDTNAITPTAADTADAGAPPEGTPDIRLVRKEGESRDEYKQRVLEARETIEQNKVVIEKSITDLTANEAGLTVANGLAEAWYSAEPTIMSLDNWFLKYIYGGAANTTAFIQGLFGVSADQSNGKAAWLEELSIEQKEIALAKMAAAMASIQERREANEQ